MGTEAVSKVPKRTKAEEEDYSAAWRACGSPLSTRVFGEDAPQINLRARLEGLLKSGWAMTALSDYAYQFRTKRFDHVTPAVWRLAVYLASEDVCGMDTRWLKTWTASHEEHTDTTLPAQTVSGMSV